jgi:hypothetical protein
VKHDLQAKIAETLSAYHGAPSVSDIGALSAETASEG